MFPQQLSSLYGGPMALHPNAATSLSAKQQLRQVVEQDYLKMWRSMKRFTFIIYSLSKRLYLCINFFKLPAMTLRASNILHERSLRKFFFGFLFFVFSYFEYFLTNFAYCCSIVWRHIFENNGDLPPIAIR